MSSKTIKGIIFDLDGTLLDTLGDLTTAVNLTTAFYHLPALTQAEVKNNIGNGFVVTITKSCPGLEVEEIPKAVERFKAYYATCFLNESNAYPGIDELLLTLKEKDIKLAVVSNKVQSYVKQLVISRFPTIPFELVYGETDQHLKKPNPQGLIEACQAMGLSPQEVLMIGDSKADIESALALKMPMSAVSWGFSREEDLRRWGAQSLYHSAQEVLDAL